MDFENIKISGADISVIGIAFIFKSSRFELWVKQINFLNGYDLNSSILLIENIYLLEMELNWDNW